MKLSDLISENHHLKFINADSGDIFVLQDLTVNDFQNASHKKLAFLYLDNSISSVSALINLMNSNHCLALLSPQLHIDFKTKLENIYLPEIIFDYTRSEIKFYNQNSNSIFSWFESEIILPKRLAIELKLLLSTSGTTGSPKFVKLSESNIVENAKSIIEYLPINHKDITPLSLPLYYSYGLSIFTTNCIAGGTIVCSVKDYMNKVFWEEFEKYHFTSISGVPYVYEMLNRLGFTQKTHQSVRYMTQAGGKMNEQLISKFASYAGNENILFYIMYGQTEATARMSFLDPGKLSEKPGSIGTAILNGKFEIDPETSELLYSGPNVSAGYAESLKDLEEFHRTEWLHTGDMAKSDKDGYYFITGRIKRMVKIFGNRVNLDETEQILKNHFHGAGFACTGIQDKILFIATTASETFKNEIISFIQEHFAIHPSAIKTGFFNEIPVTANGKPNYTLITEIYDTI